MNAMAQCPANSVVLPFSDFAHAVDNRLWLLGVEPAFTLDHRGAHWIRPPYAVAVEAVDPARARLFLTVHGVLCHASEPGLMTSSGAETLARAVGIVFGGRRVAIRWAASDLFCRQRNQCEHGG